MLHVAPMGEAGYFNLGPQKSETSATIEAADIVIIEVNPNVSVCLGGNEEAVHISRVDSIVEAPADQVLYDAPEPEPSDADVEIAKHVMEYIYDGCCIQLGIGAMPNVAGKLIAVSDLKNLGGHTEMFVDAFVDMIESGRMNGSKKSIDRFKCAHTNASGVKVSRITLTLSPGTIVTIPRQMVDYVLIEYGAVKLTACPT